MTAKKIAKKSPAKSTNKAAPKPAPNATTVTTVEEPPHPDPDRAPQVDPLAKLRRAERGNGGGEDPNGETPKEDKVYSIASRDRWAGSDPIHELNAEGEEIENQLKNGESEQ